jgi:hypothetical protein
MSWCSEWQYGPGGKLYQTLFQHPPNPGEGGGSATFAVDLPAPEPGQRLNLSFGTAVVQEGGDGVRFGVSVNGRELWSEPRAAATSALNELDLTRFGGNTISLTLSVDALGNASYDWAHWLRPAVVRIAAP